MEYWELWLGILDNLLNIVSTSTGLNLGFSIIFLTLMLRFALVPVSFACAWRGCVRQHRMRALKPELDRIRQRHNQDPAAQLEATMRLYRERQLSPFDGAQLLGSLAQMPVLFGMFSLLRHSLRQAGFLWVPNLARPDFLIAVIAGLTTALMMLANPELPEQMRAVLIVLPAVIACVFALKFASAIGLYWIASNCFTAVQTAMVHALVRRRVRSGAIAV